MHVFAQATGMTANQIGLQILEIVGVDAHFRQRSKSGIDTVCGFSTLDNSDNGRSRKFDLPSCRIGKYRFFASLR